MTLTDSIGKHLVQTAKSNPVKAAVSSGGQR